MVDDWLSVGQVAKMAGVSRSTIDRYINEGKLPARRFPSGHRRVLRQDAEKLLGELEDGQPKG
jgi:excisionase family DNA binding protein